MNHLTDALHIPDTQSERDERHLVIQRVGVKDVRYPLQLRVGRQAQGTVGQWTLDVSLPAEKKGTHMSRFLEVLQANVAPASRVVTSNPCGPRRRRRSAGPPGGCHSPTTRSISAAVPASSPARIGHSDPSQSSFNTATRPAGAAAAARQTASRMPTAGPTGVAVGSVVTHRVPGFAGLPSGWR